MGPRLATVAVDGATTALVSYGSDENTGVMLTLYSVEIKLIPAQLDLS